MPAPPVHCFHRSASATRCRGGVFAPCALMRVLWSAVQYSRVRPWSRQFMVTSLTMVTSVHGHLSDHGHVSSWSPLTMVTSVHGHF
eukprot:gene22316-biopygen17719